MTTSIEVLGAAPLDAGAACWFCDQGLDGGGAVVWCSRGELLVLHGACAQRLGVHLIADARSLELATGGPTWARRAARLAGHGLRQAEGCREGR